MEAFDEEMMRALRSFEKEDALHLQGHRAVRTGMAGFGSRTPVSQHRLGIPSPRQQQYGDRVRGLGDVGGGVGGAGEGDFEGVTVRDYAYPEWQ